VLAVSWVAAVLACLAYGVGSVLQSVGAKRTAARAGASGIALIWMQLPYMLGLGADGIAFVANVVALQRLPLFLVQSILTASVGVTAIIAFLRGAPMRWRDWTSLGVLGLGLVLLSLTAAADNAVPVSAAAQWVIFAGSALPALLGLVGLRLPGRRSPLLLAFAAGLAWTGVAVASRGVSASGLSWALVGDPLLWTIVVDGVVGMAFFAVALQRGAVTSVTAVTFVVEMVVPSLIGVIVFGDRVDPGTAPLAVFGFLLAVGGTVSLTRFAE
jgi:drug/metabolite transporter (DMT)-like permease